MSLNASPAPLPAIHSIDAGPRHAETVVLIHSAGLDLTFFDRQIDALRQRYRVIAYDLPGHGLSDGSADDCTFARQVAVAASLIGQAGGGPVHLMGISYGSMIAQHVVLAHPEIVRSLTLMGSACSFAEPVREGMRARAEAVRTGGMAAVLESSLARWFTPETREARPHLIDRVTRTVLADDPVIHAALWEVIADLDLAARLGEIRCPALVLVGAQDPSTAPAAAEVLARGIAGARKVVLPGVSHLLTLEAPEAVNAELLGFLGGHPR